MRLRPFQRRFIYRLYEYHPDGTRRYRRALFGIAKGNGKSPLAAWIAAYELLASEATAPRVIIGAASLKQANLVFGDLRVCVSESPTLKPLVEPYELQVLIKGRPGVAERIAAEAGTNDGARATAFIADELHEWVQPSVARVHLVLEGAIAKRRNAFTLNITTAGVLGDSLLSRMYDHGVAVAKGEVVDDGFLFEWYEADRDLDLDGEAAWETAVRQANPAADDFLDVGNLRHRFQTMPRFEFERYHLNRWTASLNSWLPMDRWDACGGAVEIPDGSPVWVGIDAASKNDHTAVAVVRVDDDSQLHAQVRVFKAPDDGVIDRELVKNYLRDLSRRYEVQGFYYDPRLFWESAQDLLEEGLPMVEVPQTVPSKIDYSMALYNAVMEGRLRHGGDPELREHADAAVAKDRGNGFTLEKLKASRHIDGLVALGMAVQWAGVTPTADPGIVWL